MHGVEEGVKEGETMYPSTLCNETHCPFYIAEIMRFGVKSGGILNLLCTSNNIFFVPLINRAKYILVRENHWRLASPPNNPLSRNAASKVKEFVSWHNEEEPVAASDPLTRS